MASETKGQLVTFTCDHCGTPFSAAGSWKDVWEAAKDDGWRARKDEDDQWTHVCPDCH